MTTPKPAKQAVPNLFVTDTCCQPNPPHNQRTHQHVIGGKLEQFTFQYATRLEMPFEHAMKFLRHSEGFLVEERLLDGDGSSYRTYEPPPADLDPHAARGDRIVLTETQVIAEYRELTAEAIKIRVMMEVGGERFKNSSKELMIGFLQEQRKAKAVANLAEPETGPGSEAFTPTFIGEGEMGGDNGGNPFNA